MLMIPIPHYTWDPFHKGCMSSQHKTYIYLGGYYREKMIITVDHYFAMSRQLSCRDMSKMLVWSNDQRHDNIDIRELS